MCYQRAGKLTEAVALFESIHKKAIITFGKDHRVVILFVLALADAYREAGRLPKAIPLFEQIRDEMAAQFGLDYPETRHMLRTLLTRHAANREPNALKDILQADDWLRAGAGNHGMSDV